MYLDIDYIFNLKNIKYVNRFCRDNMKFRLNLPESNIFHEYIFMNLTLWVQLNI